MEEKKQISISDIISEIRNKESNFYFFTIDTKGNPSAGIANIYQHVKLLVDMGYKAHILHEKEDYKLIGDQEGMGISDWLGSEYAELSHVCISSKKLTVKPSDFLFIPEVFTSYMDQTKGMPCKKIVFVQSHEYMFETMYINKRWTIDYGFNDAICTNHTQMEYIKNHFPEIKTHIIPVSIPEYFNKNDKPKQPIVSIVCRNNTDTNKITKSFYLQYPVYKWLSFNNLRGLSRRKFADELKKSFLAVWVDDLSSFGTFPIECFETDTPIIGKIPNTIPDWMKTVDEDGNISIKNNGIWTNTTNNIPELIAKYLKLFLEDQKVDGLHEGMAESCGKYTEDLQNLAASEVYAKIIEDRISELESLLKLQTENK